MYIKFINYRGREEIAEFSRIYRDGKHIFGVLRGETQYIEPVKVAVFATIQHSSIFIDEFYRELMSGSHDVTWIVERLQRDKFDERGLQNVQI